MILNPYISHKVTGSIYPKDGPIVWFNLRQEPSIYVNGEPMCARPPNKIGEYAELGNVTRDMVKADEAEFFRLVIKRLIEAATGRGKGKYPSP